MKKSAIGSLLALAGLGVCGIISPNQLIQESETATQVPVITRVEKRDISSCVEITGDVHPISETEIKPDVGGKLKKLHVIPGQRVHAGDLLAEIDDRELLIERESMMTAIDGVKLAVERTKKNLDRGKELFKARLISSKVFDELSAEHSITENSLIQAEQRLQHLEERIRKTRISAPADGTVLAVPATEGQVVIAAASPNNGTTLMTIAELSKLVVETHVTEMDVPKLRLDQTVKLRSEALGGLQLDAKISFIAPAATPRNNTKGFQVLAIIDNPDPQLRPGMTVAMKFPISKARDVVSIPVSAVFKGENNCQIVYVRNGHAAERREVTLGVSNVEYAQVIHGVNEGEEILLVAPVRQNSNRQS